MDTAAYMDEGSFHVLLDEEKWNLVDLRDKRYFYQIVLIFFIEISHFCQI